MPSDPEKSSPSAGGGAQPAPESGISRLFRRLRRRGRQEEAIREMVEAIIEEHPAEASQTPISDEQKTLLANILKLRDRTVADIMVPRADIISIAADAQLENVLEIIRTEAHSRYPVHRGELDDAIGMIHIKDVLNYWGAAKRFNVRDILRRVIFVAPTLPVLDMLLDMRRTRTHMALVVDEFGGVDGLLTIEDAVEEIVGDIDDEHDTVETGYLTPRADGTLDAHGRTSIEEFEERVGQVLTPEERESVDTLGGLIFQLAGRIPDRGEVVKHASGVEFQILDVDARRIRRLRIRPAPDKPVAAEAAAPA